MLRRLSATPCPVADVQTYQDRRDSVLSNNNDTTTNLEFTTEFRASLRNVKPRRRQTTVRKPELGGIGFTIHEDEELQVQHSGRAGSVADTLPGPERRRTSIAQAPQRPKHRVSFVSAPSAIDIDPPASSFTSSLLQAPRRPLKQQNARRESMVFHRDETLSNFPSPKISKPARRGTIYIPTDDTTMPSMYMGIFSPLKTLESEINTQHGCDDAEVTGLAAQMARKRGARKSILAASPRRVALQPSVRPIQPSLLVEDKAGQPSGKENLPPGHIGKDTLRSRKPRMSVVKRESVLPNINATEKQRTHSRFFEPTASSCARTKEQRIDSQASTKPTWNSGAPLCSSNPASIKSKDARPRSSSSKSEPELPVKAKVPSRIVVPTVHSESIDHDFPLLPEGLSNPEMYEDNWLAHQEVAMTQLVNNLFESSMRGSERAVEGGMMRIKLLELYGSSEMALLYRRVQGALLYGALSIPRDTVDAGSGLAQDLGRRKAFTDLWLQTYDHEILRTALEVVIGRLVCHEQLKDDRSQSSSSPKARRSLQRFIEAFLIWNEDVKAQSQSTSQVSWSYQRTVLRSLMLVKILDMVKTVSSLPTTDSLFQEHSQYKTSASVVQALMRMLNPSAGDPVRALNHLGYSVSHSQYPLEEYSYPVGNLAVDLRDGVRLTRLVELLLYRSASQYLEHANDSDGTTTILMPTGEVLSLVDGQAEWPLSQHLKVPCLSRAAKLYNVQIALSALEGVKGVEVLVRDIQAEDIVDGFREKTVRLLWGLTSKWGLGSLVDWQDVQRETKRLMRVEGFVGLNDDVFDIDEEDDSFTRCKSLLKSWARAVAGSHGLHIRNFTTSFADGEVFNAVVSEYEPYLLDQSPSLNRPLHSRLKDLGCSEQFSQLFAVASSTSAVQHIFDRDFVLASLAFLCSRLLGPSRRARAATIVQRAWRAHWDKVEGRRKQTSKLVAQACSEEVQTREKAARAQATIWRAWCRYKSGQLDSKSDIKRSLVHELPRPVTSPEEEDIWLSL